MKGKTAPTQRKKKPTSDKSGERKGKNIFSGIRRGHGPSNGSYVHNFLTGKQCFFLFNRPVFITFCVYVLFMIMKASFFFSFSSGNYNGVWIFSWGSERGDIWVTLGWKKWKGEGGLLVELMVEEVKCSGKMFLSIMTGFGMSNRWSWEEYFSFLQ